jgi:hypothetical protein
MSTAAGHPASVRHEYYFTRSRRSHGEIARLHLRVQLDITRVARSAFAALFDHRPPASWCGGASLTPRVGNRRVAQWRGKRMIREFAAQSPKTACGRDLSGRLSRRKPARGFGGPPPFVEFEYGDSSRFRSELRSAGSRMGTAVGAGNTAAGYEQAHHFIRVAARAGARAGSAGLHAQRERFAQVDPVHSRIVPQRQQPLRRAGYPSGCARPTAPAKATPRGHSRACAAARHGGRSAGLRTPKAH